MIELPADLAEVLKDVQGNQHGADIVFPDGNEDQLAELASAWQAWHAAAEPAVSTIVANARTAMAHMSGPAADAFQQYYEKYAARNDSHAATTLDASLAVSQSFQGANQAVTQTKQEMIRELTYAKDYIATHPGGKHDDVAKSQGIQNAVTAYHQYIGEVGQNVDGMLRQNAGHVEAMNGAAQAARLQSATAGSAGGGAALTSGRLGLGGLGVAAPGTLAGTPGAPSSGQGMQTLSAGGAGAPNLAGGAGAGAGAGIGPGAGAGSGGNSQAGLAGGMVPKLPGQPASFGSGAYGSGGFGGHGGSSPRLSGLQPFQPPTPRVPAFAPNAPGTVPGLLSPGLGLAGLGGFDGGGAGTAAKPWGSAYAGGAGLPGGGGSIGGLGGAIAGIQGSAGKSLGTFGGGFGGASGSFPSALGGGGALGSTGLAGRSGAGLTGGGSAGAIGRTTSSAGRGGAGLAGRSGMGLAGGGSGGPAGRTTGATGLGGAHMPGGLGGGGRDGKRGTRFVRPTRFGSEGEEEEELLPTDPGVLGQATQHEGNRRWQRLRRRWLDAARTDAVAHATASGPEPESEKQQQDILTQLAGAVLGPEAAAKLAPAADEDQPADMDGAARETIGKPDADSSPQAEHAADAYLARARDVAARRGRPDAEPSAAPAPGAAGDAAHENGKPECGKIREEGGYQVPSPFLRTALAKLATTGAFEPSAGA